ncbi:MAG: MarR family winged helix-turn-helix transcriptional regulator [Candidatus Roseilinea sp.]|uniref:MarR family winged helix-turn-helix transcriptional regulator n=1 Tax=Candidatus Roseilinea sp. TaxID=2838777 RepID=UPI00404AED0B
MSKADFTALAFRDTLVLLVQRQAGLARHRGAADSAAPRPERPPVHRPDSAGLSPAYAQRAGRPHDALTPSSLVPIIDRLESKGLVVRGQDPDDRRRKPLTLTEDARLLLARVPEIDPNDRDCLALQAMGARKSRQLSRLLHEFISRMAEDDRVAKYILFRST